MPTSESLAEFKYIRIDISASESWEHRLSNQQHGFPRFWHLLADKDACEGS